MLINKKSVSLVAFLGICLTVAIWLLVVAAFVYGTVYWYFRPQFVVRTPVSFIFGESDVTSTGPIPFPSIPLAAQDYAVSLELELPRSDFNLGLGNFMVEMSLEEASSPMPKSELYPTIRQMALLPYKSYLIELFDQLVFAPLYVFGFKDQLNLLRIDLYDFIDTPSSKLRSFAVALSQPVQTARAELVWSTKLRGFRRLMYNYPLSTCFFCVGFLWFSGVIVTTTIALIVHAKLEPRNTKEVISRASSHTSSSRPVSRASSREARSRPSPPVRLQLTRRSRTPSIRQPYRASVRRRRTYDTSQPLDSFDENSSWYEDETMPTIYDDFDAKMR